MHDLSEMDFKQMAFSINDEITIVSNSRKINPCVGCYGCWIKTPGICMMKDGYQNFGQLFSKTNDVVVISECVYGGYSPFIKNVWDRSISYLLPYFTKKENETHHKMRYDSAFALSVHFYNDKGISPSEKDTAQKLIKANSISFDTAPQTYFYNSIEELKGKTL
jgi:multimeric flavodoxin WrbA